MILWTIYGPLERSSGGSRGGVRGARAPLFQGKKKKGIAAGRKAGRASEKKNRAPPLAQGPPVLGSYATISRG